MAAAILQAVSHRLPDRDLDAATVTLLVAEQFPGLAGGAVRWLGAGWDNELFTVGSEWILRFPKRSERVPWLLREVEIMTVVGEVMGALVPRFDFIGEPSRRFPYPFVGYRRLPGVGADRARVADPACLVLEIGRALSRLHGVDPARIPGTPEGLAAEAWPSARERLISVAGSVRPLLANDVLEKAEPYLAGAIPEPAREGPRCFIHNDICPDHLLVDPDTGHLTGLIDFTDAMVGDPVLDFVGLIGVGDRAFIDQVLADYDRPLGDSFAEKLSWQTRVLTLTWLAEAAADDPDDVPKHLTWVGRAFAE